MNLTQKISTIILLAGLLLYALLDETSESAVGVNRLLDAASAGRRARPKRWCGPSGTFEEVLCGDSWYMKCTDPATGDEGYLAISGETPPNMLWPNGQGSCPPTRRLHENPQETYLIAELLGGVTNQAMEAWTAVKAAKALNRTLVLPRVRARVPAGGLDYAYLDTPSEYFDVLWDVPHFVECIKNLGYGVRIDIDPDAHRDVDVPSNSVFNYNNWGYNPYDIPYLRGVKDLSNNPSKYVKLVGPFAGSHRDWHKGSQCFIPSTNIKQRIEKHVADMPSEYSCLHARVEADWYKACCHSMLKSKSDMSSSNPDEWTCEGHSQVSCYKSPLELAAYLVNKGLPKDSALWISSGADPESLQPLRDVFNVSTTSKDVAYYMDYTDALVDEAMCKGASKFWGMAGSTYTMKILQEIKHRGGHASFYASTSWK